MQRSIQKGTKDPPVELRKLFKNIPWTNLREGEKHRNKNVFSINKLVLISAVFYGKQVAKNSLLEKQRESFKRGGGG